jgi:hypothetical protein
MPLPPREHSLLLAACLLGAGASPCSLHAQVINLALHQPFVASCDTLPGWDGLVDSVKDSDEPPGCWASDNSAHFPKTVVVDLGGLAELSRIVVHNSTNGNTKQVSVAVSTDAQHYVGLRDFVFPPHKYQPLMHSFTPRKARYVRISFKDSWGGGLGGDCIMYLREVEVFGRRLQPPPSPQQALWATLASAQPQLPIPAWAATRRYLRELGRETRLLVVTDHPPEILLGPEGWLTKGLQALPGGLGQSLAVRSLAVRQSSAATLRPDFERLLSAFQPDLVIFAVSPQPPPGFLDTLPTLLRAAGRAGCSLLICSPAPDQLADATQVSAFTRLRRTLLLHATTAQAGLLDLAALLAKTGQPTQLVAQGVLSAQARKLAAEAFARLLRPAP